MTMTALRILRSALLWGAAVIGALSILAFAASMVLGLRPAVVVSGSMEPELPIGSLILSRTVDASGIEPGAVVTVPRGDGHGLVTHRVVSVDPLDGGLASLVLRGDANDTDDPVPYLVREAGLHVVTLPWLGCLALALRTPAGLGAVLAVLAFVLLLAWVRIPLRDRSPSDSPGQLF